MLFWLVHVNGKGERCHIGGIANPCCFLGDASEFPAQFIDFAFEAIETGSVVAHALRPIVFGYHAAVLFGVHDVPCPGDLGAEIVGKAGLADEDGVKTAVEDDFARE